MPVPVRRVWRKTFRVKSRRWGAPSKARTRSSWSRPWQGGTAQAHAGDSRFRQEVGLPAEAVVTCVIDRGIFSHEVFAHAIGTPDDHLITGEKNHRRGHWDLRKRSGPCVLERTRNHALLAEHQI